MAPPPWHTPAFVTVQRVEEMRSSVRHGGAGELRGSRPAGQSDPDTWHLKSPPPCPLPLQSPDASELST